MVKLVIDIITKSLELGFSNQHKGFVVLRDYLFNKLKIEKQSFKLTILFSFKNIISNKQK